MEKNYHKRSNVETIFAMVKVRLGEFLKCKNFEAQRNELMIKFICNNICCLIQAIYEHDIEINFERCKDIFVDRKVESPYPDGAVRNY